MAAPRYRQALSREPPAASREISPTAAAVGFDQTTTGTYSDVVSGTGTLTKSGSGTVTLTGINTYTGTTTVSAGTLAIGNDSSNISDSSAVTVSSGATLDLNNFDEIIASLAGAGSVTLGLGSGGTLTLSGANTYSGGTTVSAGTLNGTTTSLQGDITNNSAVVFSQSTNGTYSDVISGTGTMTKSDVGTVTFSGANTYTGNTTVSAGTLALGASNVISDSSDLILSEDSIFSIGGSFSEKVDTFSYDDAILDYGTTGTVNNFLFSDDGTGTGILSVLNFQEGTDHLGFDNGVTVADAFIETIFFSGVGGGIRGATNQSITGFTGTYDLIIPDNASFFTWDGGGGDDDWTTDNNWVGDSAPPTGSVSTRIAFDGSARLTPDLDSNHTINDLKFTSGAGSFILDSGSNKTLTFDGVVPSVLQQSGNNQTIDQKIALNKDTVMEVSGAGTLTIGGVISGTGGVVKLGTTDLILTANNSFDGDVTVNQGTLNIRHNNALGSTTGSTTVATGATLELQGGISVGSEALKLNGTLSDVSGDNFSAGAISGAGGITKGGTGTLPLSGSSGNTFTGTTTINAGTLKLNKTSGNAIGGDITIGNGAGTDTLVLNRSDQIADTSAISMTAGGTPTFDLNGKDERIGSLASSNSSASGDLGNGTLTTGDSTSTKFAGVISGSGALTKAGSGTFTVTGSNTYTGVTTVNAGTLNIQHNNALGSNSGSTTVASGATLQLEGGITVGAEALSLSGTLTDVSGDNTFGGAISGTGVVTKAGTGTLTLSGSGANTYTGKTTITQGTLELNKTAGTNAIGGDVTIGDGTGTDTLKFLASNQISNTAAVTLSTGGTPTFDLNNSDETIGSLASSNTSATVTLGSGTLSTGGDGSSTSFAGIISGTGGVTKSGAGTFTLTGNNTYTGTSTVSGGTLALGASDIISNSSDVTINTAATLALSGSFSDEVDILNYDNGTLDFGTIGTTNHLLISDDGTQSGSLTINNWRTSDTDFFGVSVNTISQAFLDNIFFDGIGVGIGAEVASSTTSVGGGNFYEITPITTFVWDGGYDTGQASEQNDWDKAKNWDGDIAPGLGAQKAIVMAGVVDTSSDMNGAYIINSLTFRADADPFTITSSTGDTLTIHGGGILNSDDDTHTIAVAVSMGASHTWNANAGNLVVSGSVANAGNDLTVTGSKDTTLSGVFSGTGDLTKNGSGTLTLSNTGNSWTGDLDLEGGSLLLGASEVITNTVNMTIANATFNTDGNDETLGTLTLTADSTIDLGSGTDSILTFAASQGQSWTAGTILTISNWSGTVTGGGTEQIFFGTMSGNLTSAQLDQIKFLNPLGLAAGLYPAQILSSGEIVPIPIPEPSTVFGIGLIISFIAFDFYRRRKRRGG